MTLPSEMFNSIRNARHFLQALMDPKKTPGISKEFRLRARDRLKHFPSDWEVDEIEEVFMATKEHPANQLNKCFKSLEQIRLELILNSKRLNETGVAIMTAVHNINNKDPQNGNK